MFMTAIFMSFSRNGKRSKKRKTDTTEKRWQMGELNKQGEEKNRVPDTAHDCPILRIGVMHEQPVSERENLSKWELFSFFHSLSMHHKTTVISILI
jgi:hypothetical protein